MIVLCVSFWIGYGMLCMVCVGCVLKFVDVGW